MTSRAMTSAGVTSPENEETAAAVAAAAAATAVVQYRRRRKVSGTKSHFLN